MAALRFAPHTAEWLADPYAQYARLRSDDPVHWAHELDHWVITRYQDVVFVLKDARFTTSNRPPQRRWDRPTAMVTADPPDHARLRRPVNHRFTGPAVDALRGRIQEVVDGLIDRVEPQGRMDVVSDLARPLPRIIISELLGAPALSLDAAASGAILGNIPGYPQGDRTPQQAGQSELDRLFREELAKHRDAPPDTLFGDLLTAHADAQMNTEEVLDTAALLYVAGLETTARTIADGVYHLLKHPDQLEKLRHDPSLIEIATEELLRFDSPVQAISRRALEDVELGGRRIARGRKVLCVLAAANRDPEVFERPNELDIARRDNPHVAFGTGVHVCLGAALARAEIQVAVRTLARRFPKLRLATAEVEWEGSLIVRGVRGLPVLLN